ncbi:MAG TPA: response regulator [Nitrospirota bacterium]|nr:response regulator [Nitrospirota bacterium]
MTAPRILIVEDEVLVATDLKNRITHFGYEVIDAVSSGEAAIARVAAQNPDIVLMDIMLNGVLDGIKTAEVIRKRFSIPVIYLTAFSEEKIFQEAKITEPYGYVIKPCNDRELHIAIEVALYKHKVDSEKEDLIAKLQNALATISTLHGILPICSSCKKIRDDKGSWQQIESYIREHSEAEFTHGICPDCVKKLYDPGEQ